MFFPCSICGCEWWRVYGGCAHVGGTGYTKSPSIWANLPAELVAVAKVARQARSAESRMATALDRLDRQCEYARQHGLSEEQVALFASDNYNPAADEALAQFRN